MKKSIVMEILRLLEKNYPNVRTSLQYDNEFQFMIAAMLSAQANDTQVNKITPELFKRFKSPRDFAEAKVEDIEPYLKSIGLWKIKARNIKKACEILVEKYNAQIPRNMEELLILPGIGRKVANVILFTLYGINEGIAVDTHCFRVSKRLGLHNAKSREGAEKALMKMVPKDKWGVFSLYLIYHGRKVCNAKKPACDKCILNRICPSAFKFPHFSKQDFC